MEVHSFKSKETSSSLNGKEPIYNAAVSLLKRGYSVGIVNNEKRPVVSSWKKYQTTAATNEDILDQLLLPGAYGICIFTGYGGFEVVDVDLKFDLSGTLYKRLESEIKKTTAWSVGKINDN